VGEGVRFTLALSIDRELLLELFGVTRQKFVTMMAGDVINGSAIG
jgi:hypothetical protein